MAKKTIEKFYSDLSGDEITDQSGSVAFAFDGTGYEIDLTESERAEFAGLLEKYMSAGRKKTSTRRSQASRSANDPKAVRAWAAENNIEMPSRGRIPASVLEAYTAAH
jgi:hypothetical protein